MREFIPKMGCCRLKRTVFRIILRHEEADGVEMATTDEGRVLHVNSLLLTMAIVYVRLHMTVDDKDLLTYLLRFVTKLPP